MGTKTKVPFVEHFKGDGIPSAVLQQKVWPQLHDKLTQWNQCQEYKKHVL